MRHVRHAGGPSWLSRNRAITSPSRAMRRSVDMPASYARSTLPRPRCILPRAGRRPPRTWVTPTYFFRRERHEAVNREEDRDAMSRDFVGALLQLNAEKQVSREQ